jgi:hypothetical protein
MENQMSLLKKQLKMAERAENQNLVKNLKEKIRTLQEGVIKK